MIPLNLYDPTHTATRPHPHTHSHNITHTNTRKPMCKVNYLYIISILPSRVGFL
jgi:hypothetical protein